MKTAFRRITLLAALSVSAWAMADTAGLVRITTKTGNTVTIQLTENPKVTPASDGIKVTYAGSELQFSFEAEPTFEFVTGSAVGKTTLDGLSLCQENGIIYVKGLIPGERLDVFNLEGVAIATSNADSTGTITISINEYANGVYVIKTNKLTTKLIKR